MATRKQATATAVLDKPTVEPEQPQPDPLEQQVIEWATPGTMTSRGFVPPLSNFLVWVDCDLYPEYPDLKVGIRLGVAWRVLKNREQAPGKNDRERALRQLSLIAPDFEGWALIDPLTQQPIVQPNPTDYNTYECIGWWTGPFTDIGRWILSDGYRKAYEKATAKN